MFLVLAAIAVYINIAHFRESGKNYFHLDESEFELLVQSSESQNLNVITRQSPVIFDILFSIDDSTRVVFQPRSTNPQKYQFHFRFSLNRGKECNYDSLRDRAFTLETDKNGKRIEYS